MDADDGYDSDYGCPGFTSIPAVKVHVAVSYDDYCRVTAHTKSEGEKGKAEKFKDKVVISCHARDQAIFSTPAEFISVIQAVSIGRRDYIDWSSGID
jgi:hypothetical protein